MLGESDGTTGDATIEQIGRRRTFTKTLQLALVLAVIQWPMRASVHDAAGSAFACEVPGRLSLLVDGALIMAYVYAAFRAYKYVKFLNRQWYNRTEPSFPDAHGLIPTVRRYVGSVIDKPGPYRLLHEAVGSPSVYERRIYVTDGGHYDNLGLVEALRRTPAQVIVNDAEDRFTALAEAIATARMDHGIQIEIDPAPMVRGSKPRADRPWTYGIATHPLKDGEEKPHKTEIFFVKAVLAGHLGWDLEQYAVEHSDFPRRTTGDQFYDEWDFEAYRALGYALTQSLTDHHRVAARLADR